MAEEYGVKEIKEALIGINEVAIFLASRLKDGIGADDAVALVGKLQGDADFLSKLSEAAGGISAVVSEAKDISLAEGMELVYVQLSYIPKLVEALRKEEAASA